MWCRKRRPSHRRQGSVLVEFALVAFIFYMLLGAVISFGYLLYVAQGLQHAADLAAREISRTPLPATFTLEDVLYGNASDPSAPPSLRATRQQIFDDHYLVLNVDPSSDYHGKGSLRELIASLPIVNQQLVPLMQIDVIGGVCYLRYPGAVFIDDDNSDDPATPPPSGLLVAIPRVIARDPVTGVETIDLVRVVEEIESSDPANTEYRDPFQITNPRFRGVVALRFNYPVQSAVMSSFRPGAGGAFSPNGDNSNAADDSGVTVVDVDGFTPPGTATASDAQFGPNAGSFGLGRQAALAKNVRPFHRLISAQAIYRREIFGN